MALLFSDCCRDEWRSAGPAGVCRLLARAALDTLVSAPPLWAERLEETMKGHSADRRWGFWLADHGLAMGGLALLAVGAATSWWAMSVGWAALAIAFFAWVAEADGFAVPRPGRVAIRTRRRLRHTPRLQGPARGAGALLRLRGGPRARSLVGRVHGARPAEGHRRLRAFLRPSPRHPQRVVAPWPCPGRRPAIRAPRAEHLRHARIARALAVRGRGVSAARSARATPTASPLRPCHRSASSSVRQPAGAPRGACPRENRQGRPWRHEPLDSGGPQ